MYESFIIYCKDCWYSVNYKGKVMCTKFERYVKPNKDYCSWAIKRKEKED